MKALIIVDLQNDFLPGGALATPEGNKIIPVINRIMNRFDLVIASKDWHPANTDHFKKWPVHCIAGSAGAEFPLDLNRPQIDLVIYKGTHEKEDAYSAFDATNIQLHRFLKSRDVTTLYICGLATEYCVKETVMDALKSGYQTIVVQDATSGVNLHNGDEDRAWKEMENAGAELITSESLKGK